MKKCLLTAGLGMVLLGACSNSAPVAANNTARNGQDGPLNALTAGDQSNNEAERTVTEKIRQAVTQDDTLSLTAHNIKIITTGGIVTLRGPVNTLQERQRIGAKAEQVAGVGRVNNQLEVIAQ